MPLLALTSFNLFQNAPNVCALLPALPSPCPPSLLDQSCLAAVTAIHVHAVSRVLTGDTGRVLDLGV